jgi:hypothetical protein
MQVWIATVVILFALSQFWEWLNQTEFSLPVLAIVGLGLAIASNYDKRYSFPFWPAAAPSPSSAAAAADPSPTTIPIPQPALQPHPNQAIACPLAGTQQETTQPTA